MPNDTDDRMSTRRGDAQSMTPRQSPKRDTPERARIGDWTSAHRNLLVRTGLGICVMSAIIIFNPGFFGWGAAVTAAIIAVPFSRAKAYAAAFLPYGTMWFGFTMLRSMADETSVALRTDQVTAIERGMFFGTTPTIWLQTRLFDPTRIQWYDYTTTLIHWSYFFVPHIAAILIWRKSPALYRRYLIATGLTLGLGLTIYFLSPAAPPWLTADRAPQQDIFRVMANVGRHVNSSLYNRTYSVVGDSNPVAAMPSLHEAITFLVFLFALHGGWKIGVPACLYALAMAFSLVYSGEHYVIDTLVGAGIATYAYVFAGHWLKAMAYARAHRVDAPVTLEAKIPAQTH